MPHLEPSDEPVALITGASRGIGLAIASGLARAGFRVALSARDGDQLRELCERIDAEPGPNPENRAGTGRRAMAVAADLRDPEAPERILAAVRAGFGPPQVIVNNAGTAPSNRFENTTDGDLEAVLDLHVKAPFRLLRAALPDLRAAPRGCAVQLASTAGLVGCPFTSAYTAGKHAMVGLTRALAAEFGERRPRVYAVCPGFVDTDITRQAAAEIADRGKKTVDEALAAFGSMNEIGRMHSTDEVADAVVRLVREQPDGCVLNLDRDPPTFV